MDYVGFYEVSNWGRVRRLWLFSRKLLKPCILRKRTTHVYVDLCKDGSKTRRQIHHLVMEAFVGPRPEGMECRHLDGDGSNNKLDNLVWGTRSSNHEDKVKHGNHWKAKLDPEKVKLIRESNKSDRQLSLEYKVLEVTIFNARNKITWKFVE